MRNALSLMCATALLSLFLGSAGCSGSRTSSRSEFYLRGEPETLELIQAMEETIAARDQGQHKLLESIQRVVAADRLIEGLELTEAEKLALDAKYGPKKEELHKRVKE